jgi:hypothetical protein
MSVDGLKQEFLSKYQTDKDRFYRDLLIRAFAKLVLISQGGYRGATPELEYLECYNQFIILYRREGDESYFEMAKIFRKAAHRVYRIMLKKGMTARNIKFLNSV